MQLMHNVFFTLKDGSAEQIKGAVADVRGLTPPVLEPIRSSDELHIRLRADDLVETRRDGKNIYYALARPEVRQVIEALHSAFCAPDRPR